MLIRLQTVLLIGLLLWWAGVAVVLFAQRSTEIAVNVQAEQIKTLQDGQKDIREALDRLTDSVTALDRKITRVEGIGVGGIAILSILNVLVVLEHRRNRHWTFKTRVVPEEEETRG